MNKEEFFELFYRSMKNCNSCVYMRNMGEMKACERWKKIIVDDKGCLQWKQK